MVPWDVNRLQPRPSGPFYRRKHMEQCAGGSGPDGFVLIVQGGFQVGHDRLVADMAEGTESDGFGTGKRIFGDGRQ